MENLIVLCKASLSAKTEKNKTTISPVTGSHSSCLTSTTTRLSVGLKPWSFPGYKCCCNSTSGRNSKHRLDPATVLCTGIDTHACVPGCVWGCRLLLETFCTVFPFSSPPSHMGHVTHERTATLLHGDNPFTSALPFFCFNLKALKIFGVGRWREEYVFFP